jgi:hypothetical protein
MTTAPDAVNPGQRAIITILSQAIQMTHSQRIISDRRVDTIRPVSASAKAILSGRRMPSQPLFS